MNKQINEVNISTRQPSLPTFAGQARGPKMAGGGAGIASLPGGKLFLAVAGKLGVQPDTTAFARFAADQVKNITSFFTKNIDKLAKLAGASLGVIVSTGYKYYGYKEALSNQTEAMFKAFDKLGLNGFIESVERSTEKLSSDIKTTFGLLASDSPYSKYVESIRREFVAAFKRNRKNIRWLDLIKKWKVEFNYKDDPKGLDKLFDYHFDFNKDFSKLSEWQKRLILNNLELRQEFHEKVGHPLLYLAIMRGGMFPKSAVGPKKGGGITEWFNQENGLATTGIAKEWLSNGVTADVLNSLSAAIRKNPEIRSEVLRELDTIIAPIKTLSPTSSEFYSIIATLDHNIKTGIMFYGDENIIHEKLAQALNLESRSDEYTKAAAKAIKYFSSLAVLVKDYIAPEDEPEGDVDAPPLIYDPNKSHMAWAEALFGELTGVKTKIRDRRYLMQPLFTKEDDNKDTVWFIGLKPSNSNHVKILQRMLQAKEPYINADPDKYEVEDLMHWLASEWARERSKIWRQDNSKQNVIGWYGSKIYKWFSVVKKLLTSRDINPSAAAAKAEKKAAEKESESTESTESTEDTETTKRAKKPTSGSKKPSRQPAGAGKKKSATVHKLPADQIAAKKEKAIANKERLSKGGQMNAPSLSKMRSALKAKSIDISSMSNDEIEDMWHDTDFSSTKKIKEYKVKQVSPSMILLLLNNNEILLENDDFLRVTKNTKTSGIPLFRFNTDDILNTRLTDTFLYLESRDWRYVAKV